MLAKQNLDRLVHQFMIECSKLPASFIMKQCACDFTIKNYVTIAPRTGTKPCMKAIIYHHYPLYPNISRQPAIGA